VCDPVTLTIAATVASAAATAFTGYQQYQQSKVVEATARMNQTQELRAAEDAMERGSKEEIAHYRKVSALQGEQLARYSAAGLDVSFGSPLDVMTDTAVLGNADAQTIRDNTMREADQHRISAANYDAQADSENFNQSAIPFSTALNVGSTLLGGYGKAKGYMNTPVKKAA
jgi:hypothetical protein